MRLLPANLYSRQARVPDMGHTASSALSLFILVLVHHMIGPRIGSTPSYSYEYEYEQYLYSTVPVGVLVVGYSTEQVLYQQGYEYSPCSWYSYQYCTVQADLAVLICLYVLGYPLHFWAPMAQHNKY